MSVGLRTSYALLVAALTFGVPACGAGPGASPGAGPGASGETETASASGPGARAAHVTPADITHQQARLLATDGAEGQLFGGAVAISADTALIGASRDDDRGTDAGAAYIFVRDGNAWSQQAKLTADDGESDDHFGVSVALAGDTAVVGAVFTDGNASDSGGVYVFVRTGSTWTQQAKLLAVDGESEDQLGISVAIDGDTVVAGTTENAANGQRAGAAYVFARTGTAWAQQAKLLASDGAAFDQFGISVAVNADTAIVGAYGDDDLGDSSGSAFVYTRSAGVWTQQTKLLPTDGGAGDQFGVAVAVVGDTALIGANLDDNDNGTDAGSAYIFTRSAGLWTQQAQLFASDGNGGDQFATSVSLVDGTALIGVPNNSDLGAASGAAYLFALGDAGWVQQGKLESSDGMAVDLFGTSVSLSGDTALVGAFGADQLGSSAGAAYVFTAPPPPPPPGSNGATCQADADCTSGFCTDGVCCNTACGDGDPSSCMACSAAMGAQVDGVCGPRTAGTLCRAAAGGCDVAETCNGIAMACPSNTVVAAGTVCRPSGGACDVAETCNGSSPVCPSDALAPAGTVCRGAAGACDLAETCTGASAACPADRLEPAGTVCRPAASGCDIAESCSGASSACPANKFEPDLSLCRGVLGLPGLCLSGTCLL